MSEWTHSPSTEQHHHTAATVSGPSTSVAPSERKRKLAMLVAGSLGLVLVAGILFQIFRAEPGEAGSDGGAGQDNGGRATLDTTLGRVNGHNITWREVADECMDRYGRDILENMINRTIIQQACAKRQITVTNTEVLNEVRRIARKFNLTPQNWYQMLQAERGITPVQYHRDIIWPMLALKKIAGSEIKVTAEEMQKGFLRHYGSRVKAKVIMFDNIRRATEVHAEAMKNPSDFERLAQQHSIEPNSRALGGEIPPIPRYSGNQKLEEAAFKLRPGEISPVIQIGFSRWVILRCEGRTKQHITDINEVKETLYHDLLEEKTQQKVAQVFEQLRREAEIKNFLTGATTGIRQTSGNKAGAARIRSAYPPPSGVRKKANPLR